jgi:hypothetical protein
MKKNKSKKSFPDMSGDGKVTKKDILMARGVIKKRKMKDKEIRTKGYDKTKKGYSWLTKGLW